VSRALSTDDVLRLNHQVEVQGLPLDDVVDAWVRDNGLDRAAVALTGEVIVGSPLFIEQQIVASIYGRALAAAGATVSYQLEMPSREVVAAEVEAGRVHLTAEYTGALVAYLGGVPTGNVYAVHKELAFRAAARGLSVATPASATDTDAVAVRRDVAERLGLSRVSDLARVTESLVLGGPRECPQLPTCIKGFQEVYGLQFLI
jgi:osmoprotectant transport system substrate-binding protein